ncbi:MAG: uroporphyrinogen decarboxylase family protein [bacterium]
MNSRERVQIVLQGGIPDRPPFNFWMDRDKMAELDEKWGADFRITHYDADLIEAFPLINWYPGLTAKTYYDGKTVWQLEPMIDSLNKALDLPLPNPTDPAIYSDIIEKRKRYPDKAIFVLVGAGLALLEPLRLPQNLYIELYDHPDVVHKVLRRYQPILLELTRRICELDIDVLYIAHDVCGRNGPLLSPKHLREFHFDYIRELVELAHRMGKKVFYHTDGRVMEIIDLFLEYGFDGINPLEYRFNDIRAFREIEGGRLIVYGGLDNSNIIPNGSVEDVKRHIYEVFEVLGKEGKLIFSTHDIPGHCPIENIDEMVSAIKSCRYKSENI